MKPSIGRVVHYHSYGTPGGEYAPEPRAAIVTAVGEVPQDYTDPEGGLHEFTEPDVSLAVLNPTGMFFNQDVPYAGEPTPGHWSWPPHIP